jgi:hypothetical protein
MVLDVEADQAKGCDREQRRGQDGDGAAGGGGGIRGRFGDRVGLRRARARGMPADFCGEAALSYSLLSRSRCDESTG